MIVISGVPTKEKQRDESGKVLGGRRSKPNRASELVDGEA